MYRNVLARVDSWYENQAQAKQAFQLQGGPNAVSK